MKEYPPGRGCGIGTGGGYGLGAGAGWRHSSSVFPYSHKYGDGYITGNGFNHYPYDQLTDTRGKK